MIDYSDTPLDAVSLARIVERHKLLEPHVQRTPVTEVISPRLAPHLGGGRLFLKLETLQVTGTFKPRGALSVGLQIPEDRKAAGITAVSAGNHAIAAAWVAQRMGVSAKVVMLASANRFRRERVAMFGAEMVIVEGGAAGFAEADRLERDEGRYFIHPYEGPYTTLGAAGVGLEFMEQVPDLDAVVVSIGGGGLISGVAAAVKQINPACKVYGVEPTGANSMQQSLAAGHPVRLDAVRTMADSLGAPGALPFSFKVAQAYVDEVVTLDDDLICAGALLFQEEAKLAVEPAAGAALAAVFGPLRDRLQGKRIGVVVCGTNIDSESYTGVLHRGRRHVGALLGED
jgi:threonine dehydratase